MLLSFWPSLPGWDGLHPALTHFPVALLFVAPLLVLACGIASALGRPAWRPWADAALVVLALGALSAWLAAGSGHAAAQLVDHGGALAAPIARHERLGVATRDLFTLLALAWAVIALLPWLRREQAPRAVRIALHAVFLVALVAGLGRLARTADAGGRLVHERGVQAMVASVPAPPPAH